MLEIVETNKPVHKAAKDFEASCTKNNQFAVLAKFDLRAIMKEKGVELGHDCVIFDICNAQYAKKALDVSMSICTAMPCRVAVYEEGGRTKISTLKTTKLAEIFAMPALKNVAQEIETAISTALKDAGKAETAKAGKS